MYEYYDQEPVYEITITICDTVFAKFSVPTRSKWAAALHTQAVEQAQAAQKSKDMAQQSLLEKQCRNILSLLP